MPFQKLLTPVQRSLLKSIRGSKPIPPVENLFVLKKVEQILSILFNQDKIFQEYTTDEIRSKLNEQKFQKTIIQRAVEFYEQSLSSKDIANKILAPRYNEKLIMWGAIIASANEIDNPDEFNKHIKCAQIQFIQGGNLLKKATPSDTPKAKSSTAPDNRTTTTSTSTTPNKMESPSHYTAPEIFGPTEYNFIKERLEESFAFMDPQWMKFAIEQLPAEFNNPKANFLILRNLLKQNEPVAVVKFKPETDNIYYLGTLYVKPEYKQGFGIGKLLINSVSSLTPPGTEFYGYNAVGSDSTETLINNYGAIGTDIFKDPNGEHIYDLKVVMQNYSRYKTQNRKIYSGNRIIRKAKSIETITTTGRLPQQIFLKIDVTNKRNSQFAEKAKHLFEKDYVITRFFYELNKAKSDYSNAYIVFEK